METKIIVLTFLFFLTFIGAGSGQNLCNTMGQVKNTVDETVRAMEKANNKPISNKERQCLYFKSHAPFKDCPEYPAKKRSLFNDVDESQCSGNSALRNSLAVQFLVFLFFLLLWV